MADIFVSYTANDRGWAFWIAKELEKLGHTPHIHEWEISAGGDIAAWMEERHDKADHVLCVVSEIYLTKPYSSWERRAAQWAAQTERPNFALPVFIEDCKAPALLAPFKRCDLYELEEDVARARLKDFLTPPSPPNGPVRFPGRSKTQDPKTQDHLNSPFAFPAIERPTPSGPRALSNIPVSVPLHFLGRERELDGIRAALGRRDGRIAITALHGMRGVGKTTLAAAFAERHRLDYGVTWWIRAQTGATMRADLVALGVRLGWVTTDEKEEAAGAAVLERLHHEGDGILLIYDDAIDRDSIQACLPRGGAAQIIVTSNAPNWHGVAPPAEIEIWPRETGADYLIKATGREAERGAALALSGLLGGLPLAHEQAAAYCDRLGLSLGEYRKRFDAAPAKLLDDSRDVARNYGLTVSKTFALAIDEAAKLHAGAAPLIVHAALLAPEPIPLFLFAEAREEFGEPFASVLAGDGLDEAVATLRAFALIDRESIADERDPAITTDCIRLHRLVREVAAARRGDAAREDARRALLRAVAVVYPKEINEPETWPRARRLDALALALVDPDSGSLDGLEEPVTTILTGLGLYRQLALAAYEEARSRFDRALAIREMISEPDDPETAHSIYNLAESLSALGELSAARPLYERALEIHEKVSGPEDRETACCLSSLGMLLNDEENFNAARPLLERALAIDEKKYGPDHPEVATDLSNLGLLLANQDKLIEARALYERALAIAENKLGPEHLDTATYLFNLADLRWDQGDIAEAEEMFSRVLAIDEKELGLEHPKTKMDAGHLAEALEDIDRGTEARALREKYRIEETD